MKQLDQKKLIKSSIQLQNIYMQALRKILPFCHSTQNCTYRGLLTLEDHPEAPLPFQHTRNSSPSMI